MYTLASTMIEELSCNWRQEDPKQQCLHLALKVPSIEDVTRQETHQCAIDKKAKPRDWSQMQDDIIRLIVSKLRFYPHRRNFATASNEWYRITKEVHGPFQNGIPFLMLPYNYETKTCTLYDVFNSEKHEFHLPELSGKFVHASYNGWIAVMDDSDFELSLFNPLTKRHIKLPKPTHAIKYHEEKLLEWEEGHAEIHPMDPFSRYDLMMKVVVSDDGKMVVAIMSSLNQLLMCHVGDDSWTLLEEKEDSYDLIGFGEGGLPEDYSKPIPRWYIFSTFVDLVFFQGNLCVINQLGDVLVVDLSEPDSETRYIRAPEINTGELFILTCHLVECAGDLLLVYRKGIHYEEGEYPSQTTITFEIFKFEKDAKIKWSRIYDLGGKSLFVGLSGSISASAGDFVGCRPNCIYFSNNYSYLQDEYQTGYQFDNGVFCLEDGNMEMFCISHSMPCWVTPAMWLQQKL